MQRLCAVVLLCVVAGLESGNVMSEEPPQNPCIHAFSRTPAQKKIATSLLCEIYPAGDRSRVIPLAKDDTGRVLVDVRTDNVPQTAAAVPDLKGTVVYTSKQYRAVHAYLPLESIEKLAEFDVVRSIQPKSAATTNSR